MQVTEDSSLTPTERPRSESLRDLCGIQVQLGSLNVEVGHGGIKEMSFDADGSIADIDPVVGARVSNPDFSPIKNLGIVLLLPLSGFLLPWGLMRTLTWVVVGFVDRPGSAP